MESSWLSVRALGALCCQGSVCGRERGYRVLVWLYWSWAAYPTIAHHSLYLATNSLDLQEKATALSLWPSWIFPSICLVEKEDHRTHIERAGPRVEPGPSRMSVLNVTTRIPLSVDYWRKIKQCCFRIQRKLPEYWIYFFPRFSYSQKLLVLFF